MDEEASGCWRVSTPVGAGEAEQGYPPLATLAVHAMQERDGIVVTPEFRRQFAPGTNPVTLSAGLLYTPPHFVARLNGA